MEVKNISIEELIPYENNPRINDLAVNTVAKSIQEFGFRNPIIVDKHMVIIAGHTRLRASKQLGLEEVPVMIADDMTPQQAQAFRIMDNKASEGAEWDYFKLLEEVKELEVGEYDIDLTGFDEIELADILDGMQDKPKEKKDRPEVEFAEELLEEHQYLVLTFDNTMDWKVAQDVFGLKSVKALDSKEGYERTGVGRVVKGSKFVELIQQAQMDDTF